MVKKVMLFPSPPSSGSVGSTIKCIGIAKLLQSKGVEVAFSIGGRLKAFIEDCGFMVYDYPVPKTNPKTGQINNAMDFIKWTGMGEGDFIQESIYSEIGAIEEFQPDIIFCETRLSASISSRVTNTLTIMVASWPLNPMFPGNDLDKYNLKEKYNRILNRYGLNSVDSVLELFYDFADIKVAPTIPELEPELRSQNVHYLGLISDTAPSELPLWYSKWIEKPQIFIYLSVGALQPELYFKIILETFRDSDFRVICGCGFHYKIKRIPEGCENVRFVDYISIPAIIKDTSLIIFHGGQDMMLTTLANGIPSITIPGQHFERCYNSTNLELLGISKKIPLHAFRKNMLLEEISKLLKADNMKTYNHYKEVVNSYGGIDKCVNLICNGFS